MMNEKGSSPRKFQFAYNGASKRLMDRFNFMSMKISDFLEKGEEQLSGTLDERERGRTLRILLQERFSYSSSDLILHQEEELGDEDERWLEVALKRLEKGEPLQYIIGTEEFQGLRLKCDRRALIPRPETEELVEKAISNVEEAPQRILDLGTGNGCIALALKQAFPNAEVHAVDVSEDALALARENAECTGLEILLQKDELYPTTLPGSLTFDLVVSNPPYVAQEEGNELEERVIEHEPNEALFVPSDDPLGAYRDVLQAFSEKGDPGAALWMEINPLHAEDLLALMKEYDLSNGHIEKDLSGKRRFAFARR